MQLATFWDRLEREARPHVEQQLAQRGWVLLNAGGFRWRARRVKAIDGWGRLVVRASSAASLLEAIDDREQLIARALTRYRAAHPEFWDETEEEWD